MRVLASVVLVSLPLAAIGAAQETTGGVRGRLVSSTGRPTAGATLTATSPDLLGERRAASGGDGVFLFSLLPPGRYTLRVTAIGHRPLWIDSVIVRLGQITGRSSVGERHGCTDDVGVGAVATAPDGVAQHDDDGGAGLRVRFREVPPDYGVGAQYTEARWS